MATPAAVAWGPTVPGRMLLNYALDQPLTTLAAAAELLGPADIFMTMCSVLGHAELEPGSLRGTELQGIVASICRQLTALGSRAPLAELGSSTDFSDQRLNAFGLQATVSLTMLRGCHMVAASTGCEEAVVHAAAAMLPAFTATLRRGTAAQHAGQTEVQPIAPDYARLQVVTLLPIVSSLSDADPSEAQRSERASARLIQAASAWPPWLVAVLEAVEGGPADVAEEAQGALALLLFQMLAAVTADGKTRVFGVVLHAMAQDDALLERLLGAMQHTAHAALCTLGADADPEMPAEARHQKIMCLPSALVVLDSPLLQAFLEDRPSQLRQLLRNAAGWMARLPPAAPDAAGAQTWHSTAWIMAVKLLGKLCELGDAVSEEEQQEADEAAQQAAAAGGAAEGAAAAAASRQEWQACREATAAALPSAAAGFRRLLLDWPMPTDYRLQGAGQLLRPLALMPHFARGGGAGGSMAGGAVAACRLASAAMQAHCIATELMYQDQEGFQADCELPKSQYMLATEAQTCCILAAEQARRRLAVAGGAAAAVGAATSSSVDAAPASLAAAASASQQAVAAEEVEELAMLPWGMHLACHRIIQSVCRQPLKLVEHLFAAALAAFDAALAAMDARPQTRKAVRQRQALCGAHANLLWQLASSLKPQRFWPSDMGRRVAAQLPIVAAGVPAGLYTASDKMMASFMKQLGNSLCDVHDQALLEWRDPAAATAHAVSGLDSALLASPRMLAALVVQCGNRLSPPAGQLAGSTFQKLLPAARQSSGEAAGSKLGRHLAQTADALEAALCAEAAEPAVHLARVEQLGTQLAQLMHQYWEQPAQVQAAHLEQGQAAAARACAYFRCGNLLADRGAAAGESGSKLRCSACRAVNYCSRDCATLDWKIGGHKRVCKALAAARQAEQGARQAEQVAPAHAAAAP